MLAANGDRRGEKSILSKDPGAVRFGVERDQHDIVAGPVLDRRCCTAERNTWHRQQLLRRRRRVIDRHGVELRAGGGQIRPWQCLYFFPEPQGHGSLRPTFCPSRVNGTVATATGGSSGAGASASS